MSPLTAATWDGKMSARVIYRKRGQIAHFHQILGEKMAVNGLNIDLLLIFHVLVN